MTDINRISCITSACRGAPLEIAHGEPSHIHIARPSRSMRLNELRTLAAEQQARRQAEPQLAGDTR